MRGGLSQNTHFALDSIRDLFIERWIGIEPVMATTAYPGKGLKLVTQAILEKPGKTGDDVGFYSRKVIAYDLHTLQGKYFAALPGLIGILNYANSFLVVFFGVFTIFMLLVWAEKLATRAFSSLYFNAQFGWMLAFICVVNLNIPYLGVVDYIDFLGVVIALYLFDKVLSLRGVGGLKTVNQTIDVNLFF